MAAVTILNDFGTPQNKVCQCFHCFPIYLSWSDGTGCHDHECWALSQLFHSPLSLSSRGSLVLCFLFSSFLCHKCAVICISEVTDIYLGNLDSSLCFIPASVQHFSWCTWHISEICLYIYKLYIWQYTALTYSFPDLEPVCCFMSSSVASWPTYRFLRRQVRWPGTPISWRIFHRLLWSTQSKALTYAIKQK